MAVDLEDDYAEKHSIVNELFIVTADENYVVARWCYQHELRVDFFWLAVHSLEKYLKAALLLNGLPAKGYGHNIVKLFGDVWSLAPELLPTILVKPSQYEIEFWYDETTEKFIERLYADGQADNRYQLFGYSLHMEDLFKVDQIVFAIRRLCQPLEAHFLAKKRPGVPDQSRRERMIKDHPSSANLYSRLEQVASGSRGKILQQALLNWNFSFAPPDYPHTAIVYSTASQNPVLVRRLFDPLEAGSQNFVKADALWKWVKDNIHLSKELRKEIEDERAKLKAIAAKGT
jgi:hypothetical protein